MEDIISLTPKQLSGIVYHLNEELYRQSVYEQSGSRRIITVPLLNGCINCYNNPKIFNSAEEHDRCSQNQSELDLDPDNTEVTLVDGTKWSSKEYEKAFKNG
jgi:hypothetical protein